MVLVAAQSAFTGRCFTAGARAYFVFALSLSIGACASSTSENAKATRPPETRTPGANPVVAVADRTGESARARRVEDLPPAPADVRSVRIEELPAARPVRGRRASASEPVRAEIPERPSGVSEIPPAPPLAGRGIRIDDLPTAAPVALRPLRPEELNPELVRKADEALYVYNAPVGTDLAIEVNGKSYVARFAMHYHEFGGEKRPWGYHKGVTLYASQ